MIKMKQSVFLQKTKAILTNVQIAHDALDRAKREAVTKAVGNIEVALAAVQRAKTGLRSIYGWGLNGAAVE
jgi:hypothetical protein